MILYCARHGETYFNAEGRIQGQADVPLSPLGHRQAAALAAALHSTPLEAVFSSPLRRAYDTAMPVAKALGLSVQTDDRLREIHAGIFQGKTWKEIDIEHPHESRCWASHEPDFRIPGGESRRDLMIRGQAAFETIREAGYRCVLVVAHGGILTATFKALLGIPADRNPFSLWNASISRLSWAGPVKLLTLNETEHLRQLDEDLSSRGGDL